MVKVSCLVVVAGLACGSALAASETLQVNGNTVIPAGGAAYTGIVFTGPYTLSGGKITLSAGARIEQASACAATISCGLEVAEDATAYFIANAGGSYVVSGVLSGAGSFATAGDGGGTYTFSGDNTFTGDLVLTNGVNYYLKSASALGSGSTGKLVYLTNKDGNNADVSHVYFSGVETDKSIDMNTGGNQKSFIFEAGTRSVFSGSVDSHNQMNRWAFNRDSELIVEGSPTRFKAYFLPTIDATARCVFKERVDFNNFSLGGISGTIVFENGLGVNPMYAAYNGAQGGTGTLVIRGGIWDSSKSTPTPAIWQVNSTQMKFDFQDDCSVLGLKQYGSTTPNALSSLFSTNSATFRYVGTGESSFPGAFSGDLSLSVESGDLTLTGTSGTTGAISVADGATLTISDTAAWTGTDYAVAGTLRVLSGKGIPKDATIRIAEGSGKVYLDKSVAISLEGSIFVGETKLPSGTYGGGQGGDYSGYFDGEGMIVLTTGDVKTDYTWDGGGADDTSAETGDNWEGDETPDFTSGLVTATFATGGTRATFAYAAKLKGMVFSLPTGQTDFAFDGEGPLSVLSGGLTVPTSADSTARTYAFGLPLALLASQEWKLDDANAVLDFSDVKLSGDGVTLTKTGASVVRLSGNNDFRGAALSFDGGRLEVTGDRAFGDDDTKVTLLNTKKDTVFAPSNCTFRQAMVLNGNDGGVGSKSLFDFPACCTNVFYGKVTTPSNLRPSLGANSLVEFRGGFETVHYTVWGNAPITGRIVFRDTPCTFGNLSMRGFVEFAVACTNKTANTYFGLNGTCTALLSAPWVFDCTSPIYFEPWGSGISTLDITGGDQRFGSLGWTVGTSYTPHRSVTVKCSITASSNAVLHVVQEHDCDWWCAKFTGLVGLDKEGSKMLMLSNSVSTATGPVRVTSGTLALHPSASWTTASSVTVTNGTLRLLGDEQIGRKADWYLADGAQVEIPSGKVLRGHRLYLKNGDAWEEQCGGDYTSANCPFIKSGTLRVSGTGLMLLMR